MSARDELPPGYFTRDGYIWRKRPGQNPEEQHTRPGQNPEEQHTDRPDRYPVAWMRWETASGITREEYATMRAAVERCAELEAELAKVTVERDEARRMAEIRLRAIESIRHACLRATPAAGVTP